MMTKKKLPIRDLQPTDLPKDGVMDHYRSLGDEFYDLKELPQVWKTEEGYLISDGNNQILMSACKGNEEVEVDFNDFNDLNPIYRELFEESIIEMREGAEALRDLGVKSVYDLFDSFNFQKAA